MSVLNRYWEVRIPKHLAVEAGIDPNDDDAPQKYIEYAGLIGVEVPEKQKASYPCDKITWFLDPRRPLDRVYKLGSPNNLQRRAFEQAPKYVKYTATKLLEEDLHNADHDGY